MKANRLRFPGMLLAGFVLVLSGLIFAVQPHVTATSPGAQSTEPVYLEQDGSVVIEAEQFADRLPGSGVAANHTWEPTSSYAGAVGSAMQVLPDTDTNVELTTSGPQLQYLIDFRTTGDYYVYVRGYAPDPAGSNDSIHVGLDGAAVTTHSGRGVTHFQNSEFTWQSRHSNRATIVNIPAPGVYTFNLWMREDGMVVDRIWLSTDANAVGDGDTIPGPPESQRADADLPTATATTETAETAETAVATSTSLPTSTIVVPATETPAEIAQPAESIRGGLQALYTFAEGSGTRVHDVSGSATPLHLTINDASAIRWIPGGLSVTAPGLIASDTSADALITAIQQRNELTIEAWIKPANSEQDGPARIVTLSADHYNRNVTLAQGLWGSQPGALYDVRLRTIATDMNGSPSLSSPDGSLEPDLTHVVYTRDAAGNVRLYLDGEEQARATVAGDLTNWDTGYRLALANELTGDRPWLGEFHLLAIYNRALGSAEVGAHFEAGANMSPPAESAKPEPPAAAPPAATDTLPATAEPTEKPQPPATAEPTQTPQSPPPAPDTVVPPSQPDRDTPAPGIFRETFDGDPTSPQPWQPLNWDITVHSRDRHTWNSLDSMDAAHGPDCSPPPATHRISAYEDTVYLCKNHMMTAIKAGGYGLIYLTPNHMVDFSQGEAVIRFDISTLKTSNRDWWDVWITPYDDQIQLPLEDFYPDLNGPPRRAVQLLLTQDMTLQAAVYDNFGVRQMSEIHGNIPTQWWIGYDSFLTPDARRRDTFEIRLSRDHLKVGMPDYDFWWIDSPIEPLDWDQGIVQFGHHSYNPAKCEAGQCGTPNTWHWDNVELSPAVPFTMIQADRRFVAPGGETRVSFAEPAPANARLRFSGIGSNLEVSFDGGVTWQAAQRQAQKSYDSGSFVSYWTPIPEGTTSVAFRGGPWWGGDWHIRDISIWARNPGTP